MPLLLRLVRVEGILSVRIYQPVKLSLIAVHAGILHMPDSVIGELLVVASSVAESMDLQNVKAARIRSEDLKVGYLRMCGVAIDGVALFLFATVSNRVTFCRQSSFGGNVDFRRARIGELFDAQDSTFKADLNLSAATVEGGIILEDIEIGGDAYFSELAVAKRFNGKRINFGKAFSLFTSEIGGDVSLHESSFGGKLNGLGLRLGKGMFCGKCTFQESFDLRQSISTGTIYLGDSTFEKDLVVYSAKAEIISFENSVLKGVLNADLVRAERFNLKGAELAGNLTMRDASVARKLDFQNAKIKADANLNGIAAGTLQLAGASIAGRLNLDAAAITNTLILTDDLEGSVAEPVWLEDAELILNGASIRAIQAGRRAFTCNGCDGKSSIVPVHMDGLEYTVMQEPHTSGERVQSFLTNDPAT